MNIEKEKALTMIQWAEMEVDAWKGIADRFLVLSNLPWIDEFVSRKYYNEYQKSIAFWESASESLGELYLNEK